MDLAKSNGTTSIRVGVRSALRRVGSAALFGVAAAAPMAQAQVGHSPSESPFRDVTTRQELTLFGGRFGGNPNEAGVGARPGLMSGIRFTTRLSGPLDFSVTVASIGSTRYVVDPDSPVTTRTTGPINYDLVTADLGFTLNLTGRKTWRGLAPYVGLGMGMSFPTVSRVDPGAYEAGRNFVFVPTAGTRLALGRSLALQVEARDYFLRYEYPSRYFEPLTTVPPVLDPDRFDENDWTSNWAFTIGLSYRFSF
jgi:hypothetical protein